MSRRELIGLPRGIVRRHHGQPHDLLLKQRHSQRLLEDGFQRRVGVGDRLLAVPAAQVGMHHAPHDGSRPDDADLDDEIVIFPGFEPGQHGHLRAALDLEDPHGISPADHGVGRGIVLGNGGQGEGPAPVFLHEAKRPVHHGQHAEPQQVHLEELEAFQILLVPLDDRTVAHGAVLDGNQVAHRLVAEQKSAGVNGQVAGKVLDLRHQP